MKKLKNSIGLSLLLLVLISCSKDEDGTDDNPMIGNNLTGTWQVVKIVGQHASFGTEEATDVTGTIRFNDNGTGKENYSFRVMDVPVFENDDFTWISTSSQIVTDPGESSEQTWTRLVNTSSKQEARYGADDGFTYTFTLEK